MPRVTTTKAIVARKSWQERAETWRDKIKISNLITRVGQCAMGEVNMSAVELKAAQILLAKVLPDLTASDHTSRTEAADPLQMLSRLKEVLGQEAYDRLAPGLTPDSGHELPYLEHDTLEQNVEEQNDGFH